MLWLKTQVFRMFSYPWSHLPNSRASRKPRMSLAAWKTCGGWRQKEEQVTTENGLLSLWSWSSYIECLTLSFSNQKQKSLIPLCVYLSKLKEESVLIHSHLELLDSLKSSKYFCLLPSLSHSPTQVHVAPISGTVWGGCANHANSI